MPPQQGLSGPQLSPQHTGGRHDPVQSRKLTEQPRPAQVEQTSGTHRPLSAQVVPAQHGRSSLQVSPQQMGGASAVPGVAAG